MTFKTFLNFSNSFGAFKSVFVNKSLQKYSRTLALVFFDSKKTQNYMCDLIT